MKCVQCGRVKAVKEISPQMFHCTACGAHFDDDPDEGGTHQTGNPAGRMEREEAARERKQQRLQRGGQ